MQDQNYRTAAPRHAEQGLEDRKSIAISVSTWSVRIVQTGRSSSYGSKEAFVEVFHLAEINRRCATRRVPRSVFLQVRSLHRRVPRPVFLQVQSLLRHLRRAGSEKSETCRRCRLVLDATPEFLQVRLVGMKMAARCLRSLMLTASHRRPTTSRTTSLRRPQQALLETSVVKKQQQMLLLNAAYPRSEKQKQQALLQVCTYYIIQRQSGWRRASCNVLAGDDYSSHQTYVLVCDVHSRHTVTCHIINMDIVA